MANKTTKDIDPDAEVEAETTIPSELTESQFAEMNLRRGVQDGNDLFNIIAEHGTVNIVPDPEPVEVEEEPTPELTEE